MPGSIAPMWHRRSCPPRRNCCTVPFFSRIRGAGRLRPDTPCPARRLCIQVAKSWAGWAFVSWGCRGLVMLEVAHACMGRFSRCERGCAPSFKVTFRRGNCRCLTGGENPDRTVLTNVKAGIGESPAAGRRGLLAGMTRRRGPIDRRACAGRAHFEPYSALELEALFFRFMSDGATRISPEKQAFAILAGICCCGPALARGAVKTRSSRDELEGWATSKMLAHFLIRVMVAASSLSRCGMCPRRKNTAMRGRRGDCGNAPLWRRAIKEFISWILRWLVTRNGPNRSTRITRLPRNQAHG